MILRLIAVLAALGLVAWSWGVQVPAQALFSPSALVLLAAVPPLVVLAAQGGRGLGLLLRVLTRGLPASHTEAARVVVRSYGRAVWATTLVLELARVSRVVAVSGDPPALGPALAVVLVPLLYGASLWLGVVLPLEARVAGTPEEASQPGR